MTKQNVPLNACTEFADLLVDFSDGEAADEQRQLIVAHVASCAGCRKSLARLDASRHALVNGIQYHRGLVGEAAIGLASKSNASCASYRRSAKNALLSAAVVLGIIVGAVVWNGAGRPHPRGTPRRSSAAVRDVARMISPGEALWQIALLEQEARLRTSLDLLPRHDAFADQREQDERLLAKFQSMAQSEVLQ